MVPLGVGHTWHTKHTCIQGLITESDKNLYSIQSSFCSSVLFLQSSVFILQTADCMHAQDIIIFHFHVFFCDLWSVRFPSLLSNVSDLTSKSPVFSVSLLPAPVHLSPLENMNKRNIHNPSHKLRGISLSIKQSDGN